MPVSLRRAEFRDIGALRHIETQSFDAARYDLMSGRQFRYLISKGHAEIWLASIDNRPCGYSTILFRKNSAFGRLYSIAVLPDCQGRDIGKALFTQAEKTVLQKKGKGMRLEIREDNLKSLHRYQALGYAVAGHVPDYYPDHAACIKMKKSLQ